MKRWLLLAWLSGSSCSLLVENPDYCENDFKCLGSPLGPLCDVTHHRCVPEGSLTRLDNISPTSGKRAGGTVLTLSGVGFTKSMRLRVGDQTLPTTYISPTELVATMPLAPAVCGPVTVQLVGADNQLVTGQLQYQYRNVTLSVGTAAVLPTVSATARTIATAKLNGNQSFDLVTANQVAPGISIFAGMGNGSFGSPNNLTGQGYVDVKLADIDGSGIGILGRTSDEIDYFRGPSFSSTRTAVINFSANAGFAIGDLNISAGPEVVVIPNAMDKMAGYNIGSTATMFAVPAPNLGLLTGNGTQVLIDDLNGDGFGDVAVGMQNSALLVCLGSASMGFVCTEALVNLPGPVVQLASMQVGATGPRSLFVMSALASSGALFIVQSSSFGAIPPLFASFADAPKFLRLEDYDCDGNKDIVVYVSKENLLRVFLNQGNGSFDSTPTLVPLNLNLGMGLVDDVTSLTFGDWNGDSSVDVALLKSSISDSSVNGLTFLNTSR